MKLAGVLKSSEHGHEEIRILLREFQIFRKGQIKSSEILEGPRQTGSKDEENSPSVTILA